MLLIFDAFMGLEITHREVIYTLDGELLAIILILFILIEPWPVSLLR